MKCEVCGKGLSLFGDQGFKCPVCKKRICTECMARYGNLKEWGGLLGDKHGEITCPNCHSTIHGDR